MSQQCIGGYSKSLHESGGLGDGDQVQGGNGGLLRLVTHGRPCGAIVEHRKQG